MNPPSFIPLPSLPATPVYRPLYVARCRSTNHPNPPKTGSELYIAAAPLDASFALDSKVHLHVVPPPVDGIPPIEISRLPNVAIPTSFYGRIAGERRRTRREVEIVVMNDDPWAPLQRAFIACSLASAIMPIPDLADLITLRLRADPGPVPTRPPVSLDDDERDTIYTATPRNSVVLPSGLTRTVRTEQPFGLLGDRCYAPLEMGAWWPSDVALMDGLSGPAAPPCPSPVDLPRARYPEAMASSPPLQMPFPELPGAAEVSHPPFSSTPPPCEPPRKRRRVDVSLPPPSWDMATSPSQVWETYGARPSTDIGRPETWGSPTGWDPIMRSDTNVGDGMSYGGSSDARVYYY